MLGCIDNRGELIRLFWPDIDYMQHIDRLMVGITCPALWLGALWLHSEDWKIEQHYINDTNMAVTTFYHERSGLKVSQTDFALPDKPVFTRYYEVENTGAAQLNIGITMYSSTVSTTPNTAGILFEPNLSALIHYRHGYYYSVAAGINAQQYQLGGDAMGNAGQGRLSGSDTTGMMKDGALLWEGRSLAAGSKIHFVLHICMAHELKALKALTREIMNSDPWKEFEKTVTFWRKYLTETRQINTGDAVIDGLYRRSLLVFALMTNKRTGALLAAPEIDEEFTRCGRYAYCWGRDAAFIAAALDKCGLSEDVEGFYHWAARVQDEDGSWQQRYYTDGNLAPSWGFQADEAGSIIWGILKHYEVSGNETFLAELWPCVRKGVKFLLSHMDAETGLPWLSFDLWEERLGEHAYSTAAVCAGIKAGAEIAEIVGKAEGTKEAAEAKQQTHAECWREAAERLHDAIEINFWKPEWNRFVRSVRVKLNAWGEEYSDEKVWLKINDKSITRDFSLLDGTVDISLLGLNVPFGLYAAGDKRMEATAEVVEQVLDVGSTGGLMRYEHDSYIGGNPWIIATLWAALYHIERKSYAKARRYFDWAVKSVTDQGLLPEQVDRETGKPAWVIPLTWSHAMFILVLDGLVEAGEL